MLTTVDVARALPPQLKINVTQDLVDMVNNISSDPEAARTIRENFVSYASILKEGRFKIEDYVHAVTYCSFKIMGYSNRESYARTFPNRYTGLVARGASDKDISAYVAAFNKNKLVNLVLEQTLIPSWILNQDAYQRAINVQLDLMISAKSEKVRSDAANSLLTHLKKPEKKELNLNVTDTSGLNELNQKLRELAEIQQGLIQNGMRTSDIARQTIIDAEVVDVQP